MAGMDAANRNALAGALEELNEFAGEYLGFGDLVGLKNAPREVIIKDPAKRAALRKKFDEHGWREAERSFKEAVQMALDALAPTDEMIDEAEHGHAVQSVLRENDIRSRTGEPLLDFPTPPGSTKSKKAASAKPKGSPKEPEGTVLSGTGREDVLAYQHTLAENASAAEVEERHRQGVLTPNQSPVEEVLTPFRFDDKTELTPKGIDEPARLAAARKASEKVVARGQQEEIARQQAAMQPVAKKGGKKRPAVKKGGPRALAAKKAAAKKPATPKRPSAAKVAKAAKAMPHASPKSDAVKTAARVGTAEAKNATKVSATGKVTPAKKK